MKPTVAQHQKLLTDRNSLFHPLGSLPAEGPGSVGVRSEVIDHWAPPVPQADDPVGLAHFLARIAADGLWAHRAMAGRPLPPEVKAMVTGSLLKMME